MRPLPPDDARAHLADHWSIADAQLTDLGSYEDENLRVQTREGERFVLKREPVEPAERALEHAVLAHLAATLGDVIVPRPVPTGAGEEWIELADGTTLRLLTFIEGTVLAARPELDPASETALGALAARLDIALADASLPAGMPDSKWDTRHAPRVVADVLADPDAPTGADERELLAAAVAPLADAPPTLPLQVIHGDVTDHNTLIVPGALTPSGVIDFGDVTVSWRIADLAAAVVAVACRASADPLPGVLRTIAGYHAVAPLTDAEVQALWPLVLARAAACAALSARHRALSPDSAYVRAMDAEDWAGLRGLAELPDGLAVAAIARLAGRPPARRLRADGAGGAPPVGLLVDAPTRVLDLSVASPQLSDGVWRDPERLAAQLTAAAPALTRHGEIRLPADGPGARAPRTLHLGADALVAPGTPVRAPRAGTVVRSNATTLVLALEPTAPADHLILHGLDPARATGDAVAPGDALGTVAPATAVRAAHLHVQYAPAPDTPPAGDPSLRDAWLDLCPDPSELIGPEVDLAAPALPDPEVERERRTRVLAGAQELYYRDPLATVRGHRQYLYDAFGRPYLDMVNNVASVGHAHPRITAAATRQFGLLNTNSRFLYESMTAYAERLAALLPDALDTVFLVNSGSEACDLALQVARAATGRRGIVALQGAYHGWTGSVYDACTSPADNPLWEQTKPSWVTLADQPDPYRGVHGAEADGYVRSVADACARAAAGADGPPGAFISESMLGNQGAVELPAGYLAGAYAAARAAGAVCIADEIQVGYGRTGETFWAFEHEDAVPDIVTIAKAAGNGHPIGAVVCRHELADALGARAAFFSSTGGGPVSCEIGIAVLDVLEREALQDNARTVGARLKSRLLALRDAHPAIGAVHGRGLYLGVDLVTDRATREPDRPLALAVCERMRRRGIVVQPTGDRGNVLKVKPPLCLTAADAERFADELDGSLASVL